ncbi:NUDIX hydrolase [Pseudokordiimonas caeni]|uniref:NUDIX hydrolase n=1 Tax=Pseudokordiimonas caeni TaxID=2997908 RepID=UPI002811DFC0|nr:NUDIX hydrolase [Pseudokordiimonas caeni]
MAAPPGTPANFLRKVPDGDEMERLVCSDCGFIAYENPKIIAGAVVTHGDSILLCRRAIHPQKGHWTLPAGFLELHETPAEGAMREAWEEARAKIEIVDLLGVYTVKRISQVQMFYRARLTDVAIEPGPESLEVGLFQMADIPWDDLAFPSVHWALGHFQETAGRDDFAPFTNPPGWENV